MALIERLLAEPLILAGLGTTLIPLLAALIIIMLRRARAVVVYARQQRQVRAEARAAAREMGAEPDDIAAMVDASDPAMPDENVQTVAAAPPPDVVEVEDEGDNDEEHVSSAMQDLIDSVFTDDEADARYAALLNHTTEIDINELAGFADDVAAKLRAR